MWSGPPLVACFPCTCDKKRPVPRARPGNFVVRRNFGLRLSVVVCVVAFLEGTRVELTSCDIYGPDICCIDPGTREAQGMPRANNIQIVVR